MVALVGIEIIFLILISRFFYAKCKNVEEENRELDLKLQELKKTWIKQYEDETYIRDAIHECVRKFNKLSEDFLQLTPQILKYEKKYYTEIHSDQYHYKDENKKYQDIWGIEKKNRLLKNAISKLRKTCYARDLLKCLQKKYTECVIRDEDIEQDLSYDKHNYFSTILFAMLKKWLLILGGLSIVITVLISDPKTVGLFILACGIIIFNNSTLILSVALILGMITFIKAVILAIINIGVVLTWMLSLYCTIGLIFSVYQAFKMYNNELGEERKRIEDRVKLAETKINEAQRADKDSDVEELEEVIEAMEIELFENLKKILNEGLKNNLKKIDLSKYVYAYWDLLFFGNCFLKGISRNGNELDFVFIKQCRNNMEDMSNLKWRK